jgi:hypothetical protein
MFALRMLTVGEGCSPCSRPPYATAPLATVPWMSAPAARAESRSKGFTGTTLRGAIYPRSAPLHPHCILVTVTIRLV